MPNLTNKNTDALVLLLDSAVTAYRAGRYSGFMALDMLRSDSDPKALRRRRALPAKPDVVEIAVLTALAEVYGDAILTNAGLTFAIRLVAEHGGVFIVRRLICGTSETDARLSMLLEASYDRFSLIARAWPDILFADANDLLAGYRSGANASGREEGESGPPE